MRLRLSFSDAAVSYQTATMGIMMMWNTKDRATTWLASLLLLWSAAGVTAQQSSPAVPVSSYVRMDGVQYAQGKSVPLLATCTFRKVPAYTRLSFISMAAVGPGAAGQVGAD